MNRLNYTEVTAINKERCPNFTGVKEHGNRMIFELDLLSKEELGFVYDYVSLNIFEDGHISLMRNAYNLRNEEWEETEFLIFKDHEYDEILKSINSMLSIYPVAKREGLIATNYDDLINYLKKITDQQSLQNYICEDPLEL